MARKILVVARFNEPVDYEVPGWEMDIIQKTTPDIKGDMPNIGREPASFLFAIYKHYPKLVNKDVMAFIQARWDDHCPELMTKLNQPITEFTFLGKGNVQYSDARGAPHDEKLPVAEKYKAWLGKEFPESIPFYPGGMFALPARTIKKFPREYYGVLLDECTEGRTPYIFERIWGSLWS